MAVWLKLAGQAMQAEGALLPREEAQALLDMQALWERTRQQVQAVHEAARKEAAQALQEARAQGFEAGRTQALQAWHVQALQLQQHQQRIHASQRQRLAALVAQAVAQVLQQDHYPAFFAQALQHLDALAEQAHTLKVTVHPDDLATAQAALSGRETGRMEGPVLKWESSARLARGSCICESELGLIDASLSAQLSALQAAAQAALSDLPGSEACDTAAAAALPAAAPAGPLDDSRDPPGNGAGQYSGEDEDEDEDPDFSDEEDYDPDEAEDEPFGLRGRHHG
jgi:type III secretion protein L